MQPSAALSEVTDAHNADNVTGETPVQREASEKEATQEIEEKASEEKALSLWFEGLGGLGVAGFRGGRGFLKLCVSCWGGRTRVQG